MIEAGIHFQRVYYPGVRLTRPGSPISYEVKDHDCPNFGQSAAFVIKPNEEGKKKKSNRLILFCPYTLKANQVTAQAGELIERVEKRTLKTKIEGGETSREAEVPIPFAEEELTPDRVNRLTAIIVRNWEMRCRTGLPCDLDVAAVVLQRLGKPVPTVRPSVRVDASTGEAKRHGKPAADFLIRPVSAESKRGRVLLYFMEAQGANTILEAMSEFGMTRSGILTHLHGLNNDHGIGYSLVGDVVEIIMPPEKKDEPAKKRKQAAEPAPAEHGADKRRPKAGVPPEDDDPIGDGKPSPGPRQGAGGPDRKARGDGGKQAGGGGKPLSGETTALPEKGKRREVAVACSRGWIGIAEVAEAVGCSEASVKSHLNDLHTKHGLGYEYKDGRARLLAPKGWKI